MIADEFRRVELLREQNKKMGYRQFRDNILKRTTKLRDKCRDVLGHAALTRTALMVSDGKTAAPHTEAQASSPSPKFLTAR